MRLKAIIAASMSEAFLKVHEELGDEAVIVQTEELPDGMFRLTAAVEDENINYEENYFDIVTCCHSFPYYDNKAIVINNINRILKNKGYAIFVQASINNQYDKLVMSIVEKTAEKAQYLSKSEFKKLFESRFEIIEEFEVKEKFYMPTLAGFVMRKRNENITN